MGPYFRTQTLSRAQLQGGPVRLSEHGRGKTLSALQRDQGPVRLSQLQLVGSFEARGQDTFERGSKQSR